MSRDPSLQVLTKCRITMHAQESIHASFKWYEKEVTGLCLTATSGVQYFLFQYDQLTFFILVFILLIAYQCYLFGFFLQNERNYECK